MPSRETVLSYLSSGFNASTGLFRNPSIVGVPRSSAVFLCSCTAKGNPGDLPAYELNRPDQAKLLT